jgi:adenylate cyclase
MTLSSQRAGPTPSAGSAPDRSGSGPSAGSGRPLTLAELPTAAFSGVVPGNLATCGRDGEPNVTYLSQLQYVDARHVALSCQFFNKTKRNVLENPWATAVLHDPVTFDAFHLRLRFVRAEESGPVFDAMASRIQVIASHTGMTGVFRLLSADVYEVLAVDKVEGLLLPPDPVLDAPGTVPVPTAGPRSELHNLHLVTERIARACHLEDLLVGTLRALDELLGFSHSMILLPDAETEGQLVAVASRGYGDHGIGAAVKVGVGMIGTVAQRRRMVRVAGVGDGLRYGRAIRGEVQARSKGAAMDPEVPLPGLCDAQAQLALPLLAGDRLVGVLAVESTDPLAFDEWDESFLGIVGNQIALGIDRMLADDEPAPAPARPAPAAAARRRSFCLFRNDDCIFVDGEYLVRNVPAKILWKVLSEHARQGRTEFTNRELRLDPTLGLPPLKDNLESRLILLRKRLEERCPDVRLVPVRRGRFALELDCVVELLERETG